MNILLFFPTEKLKSKAENGGAEIAEYLQPFIQGMYYKNEQLQNRIEPIF